MSSRHQARQPRPRTARPRLLRSSQRGRTVVHGRDCFVAPIGGPCSAEDLLPSDVHTVMVAPLYARGLTLGNIVVRRTGRSDPFAKDEADLMRQIASRGALASTTPAGTRASTGRPWHCSRVSSLRPRPTPRQPIPPGSTCPRAARRTSAATGTTASLCPPCSWPSSSGT
ncbi:GAF domain-containing protein [Streptomyces sp. NPDC054813]